MNKYEKLCKEWLKSCSCAPPDKPEECSECTDAFLSAIKSTASKEPNTCCGKKLKKGQWWSFCGETDMGQTLPALCTECGGEFILEDEK